MHFFRSIAVAVLLLLTNKMVAQQDSSLTNSGDTAFACLIPDVSQPSFPGGKDSMDIFLKRNLRYPEYAKENHLSGTVVVSFIVETDGKLSGIRCEKEVKLVPEFADEAIRLIKLMPDWIPATVNGKATKVKISVPVRFQLI